MLRTPVQNDVIAIYETLKCRSTHAHTEVLDLRPIGNKYAMHCVTHNSTMPHPTRLSAESLSHKPQEWCGECRAIFAAKNAPAPDADAEVTTLPDTRPTIEEIFAIIGNATSEKTCLKRFADAAKVAA
jgi:hypothetical protein